MAQTALIAEREVLRPRIYPAAVASAPKRGRDPPCHLVTLSPCHSRGAALIRLYVALGQPAAARRQYAETWQEREEPLSAAYERLAEMHNALGITEPRPTAVFSFFGRPFQVIWGGGFADAIWQRIADPAVQRLAGRRLIGGIDQWSDSTDLLEDVGRRGQLRALYDAG